MRSIMSDDRVELSTHMGIGQYADRVAKTYLCKDYYEVDFFKSDKLVETRIMETDGTYHSETYADSAAENYVLGYIP